MCPPCIVASFARFLFLRGIFEGGGLGRGGTAARVGTWMGCVHFVSVLSGGCCSKDLNLIVFWLLPNELGVRYLGRGIASIVSKVWQNGGE